MVRYSFVVGLLPPRLFAGLSRRFLAVPFGPSPSGHGGTIENAQAIAARESPRTTKLYDRTSDEITLDEVERIGI